MGKMSLTNLNNATVGAEKNKINRQTYCSFQQELEDEINDTTIQELHKEAFLFWTRLHFRSPYNDLKNDKSVHSG